ncbi:unnamed protein product, partial [Vitis vinifera]|uniref:Uncharacterized protein n=1 Tax=Vitis vinifera TaxID=29760 RepID=D7TWP7_VITVI
MFGIVARTCSSSLFWKAYARSLWPISIVYKAFENSPGFGRRAAYDEIIPEPKMFL